MATPTSLPATFVAGNVLTAAQMNDLRGAFRILQVVRATDGTARNTTSTSFVDANISVTITPTSASSVILLMWAFRTESFGAAATTRGAFQITDNSNVAISGAEEARVGLNATTANRHTVTLVAYDSPATTSATTYKGRFRAVESLTTVALENTSLTGQMFALEISA